ncbi:hypothetical protein [Cellulosimicrobium sp. CUA-896]|uniref:hypothetical protein n=1 Tax=Cellulosimicrobium sp. CUA-896 TaxID=1517881 RepID=UPI001650ED53|nr:hypothetical protein [Cellulosimicrobium sp. CUA-896]
MADPPQLDDATDDADDPAADPAADPAGEQPGTAPRRADDVRRGGGVREDDDPPLDARSFDERVWAGQGRGRPWSPVVRGVRKGRLARS